MINSIYCHSNKAVSIVNSSSKNIKRVQNRDFSFIISFVFDFEYKRNIIKSEILTQSPRVLRLLKIASITK